MAEIVQQQKKATVQLPKRRRANKWIIGSLAAVIVLGGGYFTYQKTKANTTDQSLTRMMPIQRGDVTETVSASGTVQAAAQYNPNFSGSTGAKVSAVNVKVGDRVKAGQVLATLDTTQAHLQLQMDQEALASAQSKLTQSKQSSTNAQGIAVQQANVEKARASLNGANSAYGDEQSIYNQEVASKAPQSQLLQEKAKLDQDANQIQQAQASYDSAVAQMNQAEAPADSGTLDQAQAAVDQAQEKVNQDNSDLANMTIKAPADGVIVSVNGTAGEMPTSGGSGNSAGGTSGFISMDGTTAGMEISAQISQSDIGKVQVGQQASITSSAYTDKTFTGTVSEISPEATTSNGVTTYGVILKLNDPSGLLKAGMSTSVDITVGTHKNVLYVSPAALKEVNGREGVIVANTSGQAQSQGQGNGGSGNGQGKGNWSGQNGSGNGQGSSSWGGQSGSGRRGSGSGNSVASGVNGHFVPVTVGYFNTNQVEIDSGLNDGDNIIIQMTVPTSSSSSKKSGSGSNPLSSLTGGGFGGGFGGGGYGGGGYGGGGGRSGGSSGSSRGGN